MTARCALCARAGRRRCTCRCECVYEAGVRIAVGIRCGQALRQLGHQRRLHGVLDYSETEICPFCAHDHELVEHEVQPDGEVMLVSGPACYCVYNQKSRVAVGICCGRMIGIDNLCAEDMARGEPWAEDFYNYVNDLNPESWPRSG